MVGTRHPTRNPPQTRPDQRELYLPPNHCCGTRERVVGACWVYPRPMARTRRSPSVWHWLECGYSLPGDSIRSSVMGVPISALRPNLRPSSSSSRMVSNPPAGLTERTFSRVMVSPAFTEVDT